MTYSSLLRAVFLNFSGAGARVLPCARALSELDRVCRAVLVSALFLVGCNGHSINDRQAEWCVEDGTLFTPALEAAEDWRAASDGEVDFSFRLEGTCPFGEPRIRYGTPDDDAVAHITRSGDMVIRPDWAYRVILTHEFGHYLTGPDHDGATIEDVMFGGVAPLDEEQQLTEYDIARLDRASYEIKKGWN